MAAAHGFKPERGHTEPRRGAECWGKSLLVTFGLFSKVTRCKSGTIRSRYRSNGYVHKSPDKKGDPKVASFNTALIRTRDQHCPGSNH